MESWRGLGARMRQEAKGRLMPSRRPPRGDQVAGDQVAGGDAGNGNTAPAELPAPGGVPRARGAQAPNGAQEAAEVPAGTANRAGVPAPAAGGTDVRAETASRSDVPGWLQTGAAWAWRLLLLAGALYVAARVAGLLFVVVVPCAAALLLTALLHPLTGRLRRAGLAPLAATWCTLLGAVLVLAGVGALVTARVRAEYPSLVAQVKHTSSQVQSWLAGAPLHLQTGNLQKLSNNAVHYLGTHKSLVEGTVVTGVQFLAGVVLTLFVTFFLIKDGDRIWRWLTSALRPERKLKADRAGRAAWQAVTYYVRGTIAVAAIHAVVIGISLSVMNAPLVAPLAVLVFLAAFVPLVGILVAGGLAILVTLAAKGWVDALVLLGILIVMNQLEGHLLQPMVVGKMVRLHPLAIILVLAVGGVVAGIAGAVVAVPIAAAVTRAVPELRGREPPVV
ncbi:MAG: AI-2E family transporter [Streptosporangiaceae bacterium]|nr:AI-2E family transporter [Streptosporangiaceae bacterium]MBV9858152.1 AI-2E family transporter [Streptosporangiaceae bacterium]